MENIPKTFMIIQIIIILQEVFYQGSTFSKMKDYDMITSNFTNQKPTW
jgi:hypothetical protein